MMKKKKKKKKTPFDPDMVTETTPTSQEPAEEVAPESETVVVTEAPSDGRNMILSVIIIILKE